ncbi:metal-binding protein [Rhizobium anhuiense]|uniref:cadherin domain-containing protein n=1 Tax=Rhizobium anhuiense TaxID=1184720 RepID=UPI001441BD8F|nr:cadherin domain-containing protein [Rhizobium anhuiense]NKM56557.1 metal-binding protein [Rhizobium anhuiense]
MALNILDTNGATITKTGAAFEAYDVIRDSAANPSSPVTLVVSDSGVADLADELGSVSAQVTGSSNGSTITTGAGNDTLLGGDGADTLNGGAGNDTIIGNAGNDKLIGGDGNDRITDGGFPVFLPGPGGPQPELIDIDAGAGDDSITIDRLASQISGTIDGGTGIDTLQASSLQGLTIKNVEILETGFSQVSGSSAQFESFDKILGSTFPFDSRPSLTVTDSAHLDLSDELGARGAFITGYEGVDAKTGSGDDEFWGTDVNDIFDGSGGNDTIDGNAGNDKLTGGTGNDIINGGDGTDTAVFSGNFANYSFAIDNGTRVVTSTLEGTDKLTDVEFARFADGTYDFGTQTFAVNSPGPGTPLNILDTNGATITKTGAEFEAYDVIRNSAINPLVPVNLVISDSGTVNLADELGSGSANVTGSSGDNAITTGAGHDNINGGDGADTLNGGAGNDEIYGETGNDTLNGDIGNDEIHGGNGNDTLNGGDGNDLLWGDAGNDVIRGGAGNDTISDAEHFGSTPEVVDIDAGTGDDVITIQFTPPLSGTIDGGAGIDALQATSLLGLTLKNIEVLETVGWSVAGSSAQFESFDKIVWSTDPFDDYNPSLALTDSAHLDLSDELGDRGAYIAGNVSGIDVKTGGGNDEFTGTGGNDIFDGSGGNDILNGEAGNDKLTGGAGNDAINGGAGIDTAIFSGNFANYSFALNNSDHILTSAAEGTDTLHDVEFARFADGVYDFAREKFTLDGSNSAPTNIQLSKTALSEDTPIWTTVGLLSAKDADGDVLTYKLLDGANDHFRIKGNRIVTSKALDYETDKSHTIKVAVSDGKVTVEKDITINVLDVNEAPVNQAPIKLSFSRSSISENVAIGTSVGLLSAVDPEGGTVKWRLTDDADGVLKLVGNKIQTKAAIDYESTHSLTFTAEAYDAAGNVTSHDFTVAVKDVFESSFSILSHEALI